MQPAMGCTPAPFHVTTAYAILRHLGVGLGKGDYDGFHVYAR